MNSTTHANITIFNQFSNLDKLVNVFAYCRRFIHNCKNFNKLVYELRVTETTSALNNLIELAQSQSFQQEIPDLLKSIRVASPSYIQCLNPFLDND